MCASLGNLLQVTVAGESHGEALTVIVNGLPAGEHIDLRELSYFMRRRSPGNTAWSSTRKEKDQPRILSGLKDGKTTGMPLAAIIENQDAHSEDYEAWANIPRPGHADYPARLRYGGALDLRGGGHFSGRLTAPFCFAGGICLQILARQNIAVGAHVLEIGGIRDLSFDPLTVDTAQVLLPGQWAFPVLDQKAGANMEAQIIAAQQIGDSLGGVIECATVGLPIGLGGPLFEGLESKLAVALFAIPGCKGLEFGAGFSAAGERGSSHNDAYCLKDDHITLASNRSGGILGGLSTGLPLVFNLALKPTPSIAQSQTSVDLNHNTEVKLKLAGRHDPCFAPRAVPVVEALTACVLLDLLLTYKGAQPWIS